MAETGFIAQVKKALVSILEFGEVSLSAVAKSMCLTPQEVQYRLKVSNTQFSDVLDDVRKAVAGKMLIESDDSLEDIAYLTGYSALPNFYRAFKRWFNMTPAQYRMEKRALSPKSAG